MSKLTKAVNLNEGENALEILVALDFSVHQFSPYHFRVNDRLDVWPSSRKWYDRKRGRKGQYSDLKDFVEEFFPNKQVTI